MSLTTTPELLDAAKTWIADTERTEDIDHWKRWSDDRLGWEYSCSRWSNFNTWGTTSVITDFCSFVSKGSEVARRSIEGRFNVPYGPKECQRIDFFRPASVPEDSPIVIYFHGAYWQDLDRWSSSFFAQTLVERGVTLAAVGYSLAPADGSVQESVDDAVRAIRFVADYARTHNSRGLHLAGHCAGAHLIAMALALLPTDDVIKGAHLYCGVYYVPPLVTTYINEALKLTPESALELSPLLDKNLENHARHHPRVKLTLYSPEHDPPELLKQGRHYMKAMERLKVPFEFVNFPGDDHFKVQTDLADPSTRVAQILLKAVLESC